MCLYQYFFLLTVVAPAEIRAQGQEAKLLYEKALRDGSVNVYRGRILLIGQDRAGKTSLKKCLLGLPFDPKEQSTEGIEVDPSKCEIDVDQIKTWQSTRGSNPELSDFSRAISRVFAEKRYLSIVRDVQENSDSVTESEGETHTNKVCTFKTIKDISDFDLTLHLRLILKSIFSAMLSEGNFSSSISCTIVVSPLVSPSR